MQGRAIAEQAVVDLEQQDDMRLQRSVEAGLANAQSRVLPDSSNAATSSSSSTGANSSQLDTAALPATGARDQLHSDAQQAQNNSNASADSDRPKGSQLSAAEKQEKAVNSVS